MATGHALAIPRPSLEVKSIAPHSPEKPSPIPPFLTPFPSPTRIARSSHHCHCRLHAPCPPRAVGLSLGAPPSSATSSSPTESSRDPCIAYINSFFKLWPPLIVASIRHRSTRSGFTKFLLVTDMLEPRSQMPPSTMTPTTPEVPSTTCSPLTTTRSS
nr:uncharacterized protein LOC120969442 [Aegilops tauschii subsp. strangulata]